MRFPDPYRAALEDPPPATLVALLAPGSEVPSLADALAALEGSSDVVAASPADGIDGAEWDIEIELPGSNPGEPRHARAWLEPAPAELSFDSIAWRGLTASDLDAGKQSTWSVVVSAQFGSAPLRDFHRVVRLLALLAPDAAMVYDMDSLTPRSGHWLREVAAAGTPPSPAALFTIHDVAPDLDKPHWLHTHGLGRCGSIELDVLDVPPDGAGLIGQLMNSVASLFIERGIPEPDEPFLAGEDLELVWLPWEEAMQHVAAGSAGGRDDRDESHTGARGVLLCARGRDSPAKFLPILRENPLLYISDMETERMTLLASERLPRFLRLFSRFGRSDGWMFLVKLGYPVDDAESASDREHLWFEVHAYDGGDVDATLLNAPYRIAALSEGARARHSLDRLSDWAILCEHGRFDANTVAELERSLLETPSSH